METLADRSLETDSNILSDLQALQLRGYDPNKLTNYSLNFKEYREAFLRQWSLDCIEPPESYVKNWRSLELISEYCLALNELEQAMTADQLDVKPHRLAVAQDFKHPDLDQPTGNPDLCQIVWQRIICDTAHCLLPVEIDKSERQADGLIKIPNSVAAILNDSQPANQREAKIRPQLESLLKDCQVIVDDYLKQAEQHMADLKEHASDWEEAIQNLTDLIANNAESCSPYLQTRA